MKYKKIQINGSLTIQAYQYGWELHNTDGGKVKTTYYCKIDDVCKAALDIMSKRCKKLEDIIELLGMASSNMAKEVQKELEL